MRNDNTTLHMKLNSAVSAFAVAAAFSVLLPPSNAYGGICFLPDCQDSDLVYGEIRKRVIPIILPANVRNITPKSEPVPATTII